MIKNDIDKHEEYLLDLTTSLNGGALNSKQQKDIADVMDLVRQRLPGLEGEQEENRAMRYIAQERAKYPQDGYHPENFDPADSPRMPVGSPDPWEMDEFFQRMKKGCCRR
ncbi:MAG: hypothetical protein HY299_02150 [Verrucomicrobia bacterium]|nr:hypothetical protein [Verrucomicrobiota bacterium]